MDIPGGDHEANSAQANMVHGLQRRIASLERFKRDVAIASTIIGACIIAFLGYQAFVGIPKAVDDAIRENALATTAESAEALLNTVRSDAEEIKKLRALSGKYMTPEKIRSLSGKVEEHSMIGSRQLREMEPIVLTGQEGWDALRRCPDGYYVAGIGGHGGGGGKYCYNCVDELKFVCEPFHIAPDGEQDYENETASNETRP